MKKLALNMIVKDDSEAIVLYRCLSSVRQYVDGLYVTTTNTPNEQLQTIIKQFGGVVSHYQWDKSFERARNFAIDQVPETYEYVLWLDADDVFVNPEQIKPLTEVMDKQGLTSIFCDYNYSIDENTGKVNIVHPRERIVRRGMYRWKGHLHETLICQTKANNAFFKDIAVNHFPPKETAEANLYRNLEILEQTYTEEGKKHDPRTEYYYARNLFDVEEFPKAYAIFSDYLKHSGWDEERAMAENYMGLIAMLEGDNERAKGHFLAAISERPEFPTWYVNLAYLYARTGRFDEATHYARLFIATPYPKTSMVNIPIDDEMRYFETLYLIGIGKRKIPEAKDAVAEMLKRFPQSEDYKKKYEGLERLDALVEVTHGVDSIIAELKLQKEDGRIATLLNALPSTIEGNAYIEKLKQQHLAPKIWPEKSIVYLVGQTFEEWTPKSLETGLGGSETAVVHLAREWVKSGYTVTVYGNCGAKEGIYDGVEYKNYYRFNRFDTFDTLIVWRAPWDLATPFKAKRLYLDLHDVPNPSDFTDEIVTRTDKIFVKSQYHRSLLPSIPDDRFVIIPNGVDTGLFAGNHAKRHAHRVIYASSYDRGLEQLLAYGWPRIVQAIPDAELHIFYGWNLFDAVHRNNPERMAWKKHMVELMGQPGVVDHGRVGHRELIREKQQAAIHLYPTTFEEIDCISVRESAVAGCVPVVTSYAALAEKPYVVGVSGDPNDKATQIAVADKAIELMTNPPELEAIRTRFMVTAKNDAWGTIARKWSDYL